MSIPQSPSPLSNILAAKTYNAVWFSGSTKEAQITAAIAAAVLDGASYVYVPANMLPYTASSVTFNTSIQIICEGSNPRKLDAKAYGAAGNGITDDRASFANADSVGGDALVPNGIYIINSNITLLSSWQFAKGAILKPATGVTITLSGTLQAGAYQIFDLSSGGFVRFSTASVDTVYAEWWGAKADDATDSTVGIQGAIDALAYNNNRLSGVCQLLSGTYRYTTLNLSGSVGSGLGCHLKGSGRIATSLKTTTTNQVCITNSSVGEAGIRISDLKLTVLGIATVGSVLLKLTNASAATIERVDFDKFYIGAQISGIVGRDSNFDNGVAGGIAVYEPDAVGNLLTRWIVYTRNNATGFQIEAVTGTPDTNIHLDCGVNGNLGGIGIALKITKSGGGIPRWSRFTNCVFETTANSSGINCVEYTAGQDTKFTSCYMLGGQVTFIRNGPTTNYLDACRLFGTKIFGANQNGVYDVPGDTATTTPLALIDCDISDCSNAGAGTFAGVLLSANSRGFTMRGGLSGKGFGASAVSLQSFGIEITLGALDYDIDLNTIDLTGNVTAPTANFIPTIASGGTISPDTPIIRVSGNSAIASIVLPRRVKRLLIIPSGIFTWTVADNIAVAGTAVVGKLLIMQYDVSTTKWYPSYV